jgi:hypothetical protein
LIKSEEKMVFETRAKRPGDCSPEELADFLRFAQDSGEVSPVGLDGRIRAAEKLIFCRHDGKLIGIAGVKHPVDAYRQYVSDGSGVILLEKDWPLELGWIFVVEPFRRKGASTSMVECALRDLTVPVFSTSRVENAGTHVILKGHRFAQAGEDYDSEHGDYQLRLFTRPA